MENETQEIQTLPEFSEEELENTLSGLFSGNVSSAEGEKNSEKRAISNLRLALDRNGLTTGDIARSLAGIAKNSDNDRTRLQAIEMAMQAQGLLAKEIESGEKVAPVVNITINRLTTGGKETDSLGMFIPMH